MKSTRLSTFASSILFCLSLLFFSFAPQNHEPIAVLDHPELDDVAIGGMSADEFVKTEGVKLENVGGHGFEVAYFEIVWVAKGKDPIMVTNWEGKFNDRSEKLVKGAASGDVFYIEKISAKPTPNAPESEWVKLNSIVVKIE